ncbi:TrkA C-terminal domain protein [Hoylesella oralis ATCC 33269]|uniref:TrkA C-terminal domain protein n=2 Tax=Hoylesella oralis TaxID=28134 RepID=E7RRC2_9BACT|nr:cation:proton antiporter [Hoylesella oralis]EFZ36810.1 TrkA C-terminal domain protein [Hoylesella oralis ATCC 33269]EPH18840.1 hypothetical protein HMPREF1475_00750 [Hoylesella oralis HGA0225]SHF73162.1 monovalent cation:H+ antiporter-2, CPA2 family [Hoylesella oralis]
MADLPNLIKDLALILVVAGAVTLIFKKLKQPLVLGYIVAGFLVSPNMPYLMSVVDKKDIQTWADIGVIFLLFSMGLDFSFKKITKLGMSPFIAVTTILLTMPILGYAAATCFGWSHMEAIFLGAIFAICSSTTIIYKTLTDLKLKQQRFANIVLTVLVLEDVISIVLMVMLSALATGKDMEGSEILAIILKIVFFIVLWFVVGIFLIPLLLRKMRKLLTNEILLIVSLALCFFMAILSSKVGFSSAFGAFIMGSILAETVEGGKIIKVVDPLKDLFGAVFFVSVGMLVDPHVLIQYALPILIIVILIIVGQAIFGTFAFLLSGQSLKTAMQCSFSMAQIGEFPFIIVSLGLSLGVIGEFMYPVIVVSSAITTFFTPYVIKASIPCYNFIEQRLPKRWIKLLNRQTMGEENDTNSNNYWRNLLVPMVRQTAIYIVLTIAAIVMMFSFFLPFARHLLSREWANIVTGLLTLFLIAPFLRAIIVKKNHSKEFKYLWGKSLKNRPTLVFTIVIRTFIAIGFIFYILNYLSNLSLALITSIAIGAIIPMILSRSLKKRSIKIERIFIQNLHSKEIAATVLGHRRPLYATRLLDRDVHIAEFEVPENSTWGGKTLKELNLRSRFRVHISSILRGKQRLNIPNGDTVIFPFDRIEAIGNDEQLTTFSKSLSNDIYPDDPEIEKREMKLRQMIIKSDSPFIGKTLGESGIRDKYNCMVVGVEEGQENLTMITPSRKFEKGDIIWVVGEEQSLAALGIS